MIDRIKNPFSGSTQRLINPVATPIRPQTYTGGFTGIGAPDNKPSFGHLAGVTKNGPGSFMQNAHEGLGNNAIQAANGELGRKLFISV